MRFWRSLHALLVTQLVLQPVLFPAGAYATIDDSSQFSSRLGRPTPAKNAPAAVSPSLFNGDARYEVPIEVPADPGGMTPRLALRYSSGASRDSWVGYGWDLSTSQIRRSLRDGTPRYSDAGFCAANPAQACDPTTPCPTQVYTLVIQGEPNKNFNYETYCKFRDRYELDGELLLLESSAGGIDSYRTRREMYAIIEHDTVNNRWTVARKNGVEIRYGWSPATRVDSTAGPTYAWLIEDESDPRGNTVNYTYHHDGGRPYLLTVTYGQSAGQGWTVTFATEPRLAGTTRVAYRAGFEQRLDLQLRDVVVAGGDGARIRRYEPSYIVSPDSGRLLLERIVAHGTADGSQGGSVPAMETSFSYSTNSGPSDPKGFVVDVISHGHDSPFLTGMTQA